MTICTAQANIRRAKWAFLTRQVRREDAVRLTDGLSDAISSELVLVRVERIGSHRRLRLASERLCELYAGDLVVAAVGALRA